MTEELKFPVDWQYHVTVFADAPNIPDDLIQVLRIHGSDAMPVKGNVSKTGKYVSWKIQVTFQDREMMESLSRSLAAVQNVKLVL